MTALWLRLWRACHELKFGGDGSPYWSRLEWPDGGPAGEQDNVTFEVFAVVKRKMTEVLQSEVRRSRGVR